MSIVVALISISVLTGIAFAVRRFARISVCPICVGVSGTWAWMLGIRFMGVAVQESVIMRLMWGSGVGIAYDWERRADTGEPVFKLVFVSAGFLTAWAIVTSSWEVALIAGLVTGISPALVRRRGDRRSFGRARLLEEKMKECC
jgi:hypothetical protein